MEPKREPVKTGNKFFDEMQVGLPCAEKALAVGRCGLKLNEVSHVEYRRLWSQVRKIASTTSLPVVVRPVNVTELHLAGRVRS
jgi:hypothetical protein